MSTTEELNQKQFRLRKVFGLPLSVLMPIHPFLHKCIEYVRENGLKHQHLFLHKTPHLLIEKIVKDLNKGLDVDPSNYGINTTAALIIHYLESLPDPLLSSRKFINFLAINEIPNEKKIHELIKLLNSLPIANQILFLEIYKLFYDISQNSNQNLMNIERLSKIFGPSILFLPNLDSIFERKEEERKTKENERKEESGEERKRITINYKTTQIAKTLLENYQNISKSILEQKNILENTKDCSKSKNFIQKNFTFTKNNLFEDSGLTIEGESKNQKQDKDKQQIVKEKINEETEERNKRLKKYTKNFYLNDLEYVLKSLYKEISYYYQRKKKLTKDLNIQLTGLESEIMKKQIKNSERIIKFKKRYLKKKSIKTQLDEIMVNFEKGIFKSLIYQNLVNHQKIKIDQIKKKIVAIERELEKEDSQNEFFSKKMEREIQKLQIEKVTLIKCSKNLEIERDELNKKFTQIFQKENISKTELMKLKKKISLSNQNIKRIKIELDLIEKKIQFFKENFLDLIQSFKLEKNYHQKNYLYNLIQIEQIEKEIDNQKIQRERVLQVEKNSQIIFLKNKSKIENLQKQLETVNNVYNKQEDEIKFLEITLQKLKKK
ncbi:rho gtpase-activating protein 68f [Anaeramoeba flamelloides]|uniref:Rho gtpase-activating protein 68f n=1 Tax=Anaeramoeba flamelloides TaxID=1746091 RepID=A0ABQ8YKA6_9EUKA|nr:rho gtpase-activating protein 68f [Anaeramoeba flamelloides]